MTETFPIIPLGIGQELKDYMIEHFNWPPSESCIYRGMRGHYLEQTFMIEDIQRKPTDEVLGVIKAYYLTKTDQLLWEIFHMGPGGSLSDVGQLGSYQYDSINLTNINSYLMLTILTVPLSHPLEQNYFSMQRLLISSE